MEAFEDYNQLQKENELDGRDISQILAANIKYKKENEENYLSAKILDQFRQKNRETTLYLYQIGNKQIWQPDKFLISRKVKVAQDINELLDRKFY